MHRQRTGIIVLAAVVVASFVLLSARGVVAQGWTAAFRNPLCDVNRDGRVDELDRQVLLMFYGQPTTPGGIGDINLDGWANLLDMVDLDKCLQAAGSPDQVHAAAATGDANADGSVNLLDLTLVSSHYGRVGPAWMAGDLNGDGVVDLLDLTLVSGNLR